ncbi:MAG: ABC transporter ATP-binding protein [Dehalococcoidia bacterium]
MDLENFVIETTGLTKRFGSVTAVSDLGLRVPQGGVFGLLGPNGSGKTTTMSMLLGLVRPTAGTFRVLGQEGASLAALRRTGAIVETPSFYPYLSGRANLRYFQGITGRGSPSEVDQLLRQVDLADNAHRKFSTYSLGMKHRLGIAYALLGEPELMFLDEPTNGLDPAGMAEVRDLIQDLGGGGRTVVLSSHLLHEVEQVCDGMAILSRGKLIAQDRVQNLLRQPGTLRLKTNDDQRASQVLADLDWVGECRREEGYLSVAAPPERSWELSKALAQQEVYVSEMYQSQASLEEYFLEVTGDDLTTSTDGKTS